MAAYPRGDFTPASDPQPTARINAIPMMPARSDPNKETHTPKAVGAIQLTARPVVA